MFWQAWRKTPPFAVLAGYLFAGAASPASADEARYCVTCTNPDQTYVCRVAAGGSKASDALKLYCVIRLAKEGHHASCTAERGSNCNGVEKVYSYDGPMPDDLASNARIKDLQDKVKQQQKAFEKPKGDEPHTLVELTGRAVSASRERWRNTRNALVGSSQSAEQPLPRESTSANEPAAGPNAVQADGGGRADDAPGFARRSYRCVMSLFRNCGSGSN